MFIKSLFLRCLLKAYFQIRKKGGSDQPWQDNKSDI